MRISRHSLRVCGCALCLGFGLVATNTRPVFAAPAAPLGASATAPELDGGATLDSSSYILGPSDQLNISVLDHADLTETVTILPDGTIRYPIVGAVHAAGLTVDGLSARLATGLASQLNDPQVTVSVLQSRPSKISVLGAVKSPGQYDVGEGTHLLDILAACGGPAQDANLTQATLVTDGGRHSVSLDVPGLLAGTDPAENLPLAAGDVLLVQARDASFAEVQVTGQVTKPGAFPVPPTGDTVLDVLNDAGGATPTAALTQAQILHAGQVTTIDLRPLQNNLNDPSGQVKLLPGDVLMVPTNTAQIAVLGDVHTPGAYPIPDGSAMTITDAMTVTGGPNADANTKDAAILRRDPAGRLTEMPLNLDALLHGKSQTADATLRPGDILYVPTRGSHTNPLQQIGEFGFLAPFLHL